MCIYIYVCMYVCTYIYVCMYVCMYVCRERERERETINFTVYIKHMYGLTYFFTLLWIHNNQFKSFLMLCISS